MVKKLHSLRYLMKHHNSAKEADWVKVFYEDCKYLIRRKEAKDRSLSDASLLSNARIRCANKFLEKGLPFHIKRELVLSPRRFFSKKHNKFIEGDYKSVTYVMYVRPQDVMFAYLGRNNFKPEYTHKHMLEMQCMEICGKPLDYWLTQNQLKINTVRNRLKAGWTFAQSIFTPNGGMSEYQLKKASKKDLDKFITHANARRFR